MLFVPARRPHHRQSKPGSPIGTGPNSHSRRNHSNTSMILKDLSEHLAHERQAAVFELAQRFGADREVIRGMLAVLERKSLVRRLPTGTMCSGGCMQCSPDTIEIYEWLGPRETASPPAL